MDVQMQDAGAYVEQIPAGAKPPALRVTAAGKFVAAPAPPAGLYVQIADVRTQSEAIRASLLLADRLGAERPRFVRGEVVGQAAGAHILMYAGPFGDAAAARAFCDRALPAAPCVSRVLEAGKAPAPAPRGREPR